MSRLRPWRLVAVLAGGFVVITGLAALVLSNTLSNDPVPIHVRWKEDVSDVQRAALERRFGLVGAEPREKTTYAYLLADFSTDNIRAMVQDPNVDDTSDINRIRFRPASLAHD